MSTVENYRNKGDIVDVLEDDSDSMPDVDDNLGGAHSLGEEMMTPDSDSSRESWSLQREEEAAIRNTVGDVRPFTVERIREDVRLQREFSGRYVAYKDRWRRESGVRTLIRTVLADAATPWDLERAIAQLPAKNRHGIARRFVEKTDAIEE